MTIKKLYIIRHGQTEYNKQGKVQGSGIDAPLNKEGERQAARFFELYQEVAFDKIYISGLQRTRQSVQRFIEQGVPVESLKSLNEISWGIQEGKSVHSADDSGYAHVVQSWSHGHLDHSIEGGESPLDVVARQKTALDHIFAQTQEQNVLICMHGRAMRILLSEMLQTPLHEMDQYEHSNLCLYRIDWDGTTCTLIEANRPLILQTI